MDTIVLHGRDRAIFENLTEAISKLAKGEGSFHQRQVPALRRQTRALDYIMEERKHFVEASSQRPYTKHQILPMLDKISELLVST